MQQQLKNRMAVQGSDKLKLNLNDRRITSSSAKSTLHSGVRKPVSYNDSDYDDDVPLGVRLAQMPNLGTPSAGSNSTVPIKKRTTSTTTMPSAVKRPFDDNSSLSNKSVKKSKVAPCDHRDKDKDRGKDDTPLSRKTEMRVDGSADKSFSSLKKEFKSVQKSIQKCQRKCQEKENKLESIRRDIEDSERKRKEEKKLESIQRVTEKELISVESNNETHKNVEENNGERVTHVLVKEVQLGLMDELIRERKQELKENETKLRGVMDNIDKVCERQEKCTAELENKERELDALKKQVDEQAERLKLENKALLKIMQINKNHQIKEFESRKKQLEEQVKELESEKQLFEGQLKKLRSEEKLLEDRVKSFPRSFEGRVKEFESKEEELKVQMLALRSNKKLLEDQVEEFKSMEDEFEGRIKEFDSKEKQLGLQVKELESEKEQFEEQVKKLESEKKLFEGRLKKLRSKEKLLEDQLTEFRPMKDEFEGRVKQFESKEEELKAEMQKLRSNEKLLEDQLTEFQSMKDEFEGRVKQFESKEEELKAEMQKLRSNEKLLEGQMKEFKLKEDEFKDRIKELDSKEKKLEIREKEVESETKKLEGRIKKFDSKEKQLEIREKEVESEKKQLEGRIEEFDSEEKQLKIKVKELETEKKQFEGKFKELWSKEEEFKARMQELKRFVSQMEDFKSEEKHFDEGPGKELESKDKKFEVHVKEPKSKEKRLEFDVHMKDLESKPNKVDGHLKQYDALIELMDKETELGNQASPTSEENDEFELADSDTLVNLQGVLHPAKVVLEIIQHPTIENCKMGDNDVIIGDKHILLLEKLMRLSPAPHIEPDVRKEALKLALELKANAEENNENSVPVLGFLLLLSIFGLVSSFDEDVVIKFLGLVSQHSIAIELFRAMGFADKISDFVAGLIKRQQYVEAVDLLRKHVQNAKLISESSCNKTNSIEIKDKARDQEIASLETVLQCLSDNNLELDDLHNEIDNRILELRSQKGE